MHKNVITHPFARSLQSINLYQIWFRDPLVAFGVHLTQNLWPHLYIRSSRRALTSAMQSWRARWKRRLTNCNECWTLQPVWSAVFISSPEACRDSSIPSYIGWMLLSESCTNSASWCSTVCTVKRLSTSWNCANQSQVSHHGNIFDPPPNISWSYRVTSSAPMVDRLSVWLVRQSGIPCWTACGIQLLTRTVSDNLWRRFCLQRTDAFSALEVSRRCAIQINFLLTYLLTYLWTYVINSAQICCSQHRGFDSVGVKICHLPLTWPVDINTVLALLHSLW